MWIISISENYEVNGMSVRSFGCPNFLYNMIFIFWLRNMEVMNRITTIDNNKRNDYSFNLSSNLPN